MELTFFHKAFRGLSLPLGLQIGIDYLSKVAKG